MIHLVTDLLLALWAIHLSLGHRKMVKIIEAIHRNTRLLDKKTDLLKDAFEQNHNIVQGHTILIDKAFDWIKTIVAKINTL